MAASKKALARSSKGKVINISAAPPSKHKRAKVSSTVPAEALPTINAMRKRLKMTMAQFINSLLAYAAWCEKDHPLTGDAIRRGGADERGLWAEVIREFGKPNKTGSYFEHVLAERFLESIRKIEAPKT